MFENTTEYRQENKVIPLTVMTKEIEWSIALQDIPLPNKGITDDTSDVTEQYKQLFLDDIVFKGVIRKMKPGERGYFRPILFLNKNAEPGSSGLRKMMDFRLLNEYLATWRSELFGMVENLKRIPSSWNIFTSIGLKHGYYHIPVSKELQWLFCFETNRCRCSYRTLPRG